MHHTSSALLLPFLVLALGHPLPAQVEWTQRRVLSGQGCPMAYDAGRGRVVAFSGLGETYEYDGAKWSVLSPKTNPVSRCGHAMAYDTARKRVVFFGGHNEYPPYQDYADTWEWDGADWSRRSPTTAPSARWGYAMDHDVKRGRSVLFGGSGSSGSLADTWEWDGGTWHKMSPTTSPPARWFHGMAYDSARGVMVLFGGASGSTVFADTWEWDGKDWTKRSPVSAPPARFAPGMAFDPARKVCVVFGGDPAQQGKPCQDDTWEWNGTTWTQARPKTVPAARYRPGMVWDATGKRVLMFSGNSGSPDFAGLTDTWSFDGTDWKLLLPDQVPVRGAMAWDTKRRRAVLHGGYMAVTAQLSETWEWDGTAWTRRMPVQSPPARARSAVAWDGKRGRLVLFGGNTGTTLPADTWEWDGSNWAQATPASSPPGRTGHAMAWDEARGRTVVQGGITVAGPRTDTWLWDGTAWTNATQSSAPGSIAGHAMAYDERRERLVLFGGIDVQANLLGETWEWDGSRWSRVHPAKAPSARFDHAMTYDPVRGRVVLFGGNSLTGESFDTWEWDGTSWTQRNPTRMPRTLPGQTMTYDLDREVVVFFGNHTWEYAPAYPAGFTSYGTGCAGSQGTPALATAVGQRPWLGESFSMQVGGLQAPILAVLWLGASRTQWGTVPLPFDLGLIGMKGCSLRASTDWLLPVTSTGTVQLPIPNLTALLGAQAFAQAIVLDLPANPAGLIASNGGEIRFGGK